MKLVFDIGGTHTRLAVSPDGQTLQSVTRFNTDPTTEGCTAFIDQVERLAAESGAKSIVGGVPGQFDQAGHLRDAPNLPGWEGLPLVRLIESHTGLSVATANDVMLVGLGEATRGAGRGREIVAYITVSTGVNGARFVNGRLDANRHGFELGYMLMPNEAGELVSLESLTGGAALHERYGRPPKLIKDPAVWRQEERYLALALYNTVLHWSPDVVIYGGGMMRDISLQGIQRELDQLPHVVEAWPQLALAKLGDEGGLYGALEYGQNLSGL